MNELFRRSKLDQTSSNLTTHLTCEVRNKDDYSVTVTTHHGFFYHTVVSLSTLGALEILFGIWVYDIILSMPRNPVEIKSYILEEITPTNDTVKRKKLRT